MRRFGWLASVVIGISAITACTGNGEDDETEEPPDGVLNICQQWSEEEYDEHTQHAEEAYGRRQLAEDLFTAAGCSTDSTLFVSALGDFSQEAQEGFPEAGAWAHPDALATAFDEYLGAPGLLASWSVVVSDESNSVDEDSLRRAQESLGISLAEVTHADREASLGVEYVDRLREISREKVLLQRYNQGQAGMQWDSTWELEETGPVVHGWSVLAPLLRFGDFHEDFLVPVATDIVEFDQEVDGDWSVEGEEQISFDMFAPDATDAMEPVLEALSRNLDAAEQVFDATGDPLVEELLET